jgi:hypothetical protein
VLPILEPRKHTFGIFLMPADKAPTYRLKHAKKAVRGHQGIPPNA